MLSVSPPEPVPRVEVHAGGMCGKRKLKHLGGSSGLGEEEEWLVVVLHGLLNTVTHKDAYPLPRFEVSLTGLKKAAWYSESR